MGPALEPAGPPLPAMALWFGQSLHLLASLSGWTWGCKASCRGQAGTPTLEHLGDISYNLFQQMPLPVFSS